MRGRSHRLVREFVTAELDMNSALRNAETITISAVLFVATTTTHFRAMSLTDSVSRYPLATLLLSARRSTHPFMSASGSIRMVHWPGIEAFQPTNYTPGGPR